MLGPNTSMRLFLNTKFSANRMLAVTQKIWRGIPALRRTVPLLAMALAVGSMTTFGRLAADEPAVADDAAQAGTQDTDQQSKGMPLVFSEDFQQGSDRWETTDDTAWTLSSEGGNQVFGLNRRVSDYQPKFRSPHNIAMIKDIELSDFVLIYKVKSTNDTGNHRDCCTFFGYQDPTHFYYVHLGAKPDPASGQIMIVNDAARRPLTENKKLVPWDDQWHTVKVVRDSAEGTIEIYFDDMETPHMTVVDKTFGKGKLGIGSFDDQNDFDDIKLYGM